MMEPTSSHNGTVSQGLRPDGFRGYGQVRAVEQRAASAQYTDDAKMAAAVKRLDGLLKSETPIRTDVPRGFYLNIAV